MGGPGPPHSQPAHLRGSPAPGDGAIPAARPPGHGDHFRDQQILAKEPHSSLWPFQVDEHKRGEAARPWALSAPRRGLRKEARQGAEQDGDREPWPGRRCSLGASAEPDASFVARAGVNQAACHLTQAMSQLRREAASRMRRGGPAWPRLHAELPHLSCVVMVFSRDSSRKLSSVPSIPGPCPTHHVSP